MDEGHTLDNGSVWHKDWPHRIYVGQWPIFRDPVTLLNIFKTVWWRNIIFGIIDQCDTKVGLIKQMWVSDLYFIVQWFYFTSWRLFDGWRSYLIYKREKNTLYHWWKKKYMYTTRKTIWTLQDMLDKSDDPPHPHHLLNWHNRSVWHKDWPHKIYIGQWPVFCVSDCTFIFWRIFDG